MAGDVQGAEGEGAVTRGAVSRANLDAFYAMERDCPGCHAEWVRGVNGGYVDHMSGCQVVADELTDWERADRIADDRALMGALWGDAVGGDAVGGDR